MNKQESYQVLTDIFNEKYSPEEIKEILLNMEETVEEIVGFATAMREAMTTVNLHGDILDVCGTGGSGKERFNISTASAFILASMEIPVAKHGNYGSKKPNGSFNFLDALHINYDLSPSHIESLFQQTKLCFLFARAFHPAMKVVAPIRKEIGKRTIFNILGPLCNPANNTHHVMGTTQIETAEKLAQALQQLGTKRALVIVGGDGLDEISPTHTSTIFDVTPTSVTNFDYIPSLSDYECGTSEENAQAFSSIVLQQTVDHPLTQQIALSAGASLYCMGKAENIDDGYEKAVAHLRTTTPSEFFENFRTVAQTL